MLPPIGFFESTLGVGKSHSEICPPKITQAGYCGLGSQAFNPHSNINNLTSFVGVAEAYLKEDLGDLDEVWPPSQSVLC
jgi:hypothetical protein